MHITSEDDFLMAIEEHLISKEANAQNILFDLDVDTHLEQAKEPPSLQQNVSSNDVQEADPQFNTGVWSKEEHEKYLQDKHIYM
jgi:hypothetical protein